MSKRKRKLTARERAARKRRRKDFVTIFLNGKQKRVKKEPMIDGAPVDEFIRNNADALWYHQNEMWDEIEIEPVEYVSSTDTAQRTASRTAQDRETEEGAFNREREESARHLQVRRFLRDPPF